jgi:hypothetical protein
MAEQESLPRPVSDFNRRLQSLPYPVGITGK